MVGRMFSGCVSVDAMSDNPIHIGLDSEVMYDHNMVLVRHYPCDQRVPFKSSIVQVV